MKIEISENCQELPRAEFVQFFKTLDAALSDGLRDGSANKDSFEKDPRDFIDSVYFGTECIYLKMYAYSGSYAEDKITPRFINELNVRLGKVGLFIESIVIREHKDGWTFNIKSVIK